MFCALMLQLQAVTISDFKLYALGDLSCYLAPWYIHSRLPEKNNVYWAGHL